MAADVLPCWVRNPVLRGFHPDPSICRVGEDYYLVNSSFEWLPGVPVHHSRDLEEWRLIGHVLTDPRQIELRGVADSGGVWAPSLSHADGRFWLVFTNVRNNGFRGPFKDIRVFLTTAEDVLGPWSEPLELGGIGFDPSLWHAADGRKWLVNMVWDFRKGREAFAGIVLQEFDPLGGRLVGEMRKIFDAPGIFEGPNIYQRGGWFYLMLAQGGTGWDHAVVMARARTLDGPYELDPAGAVVTSRGDPGSRLQKAGHGELVECAGGEWLLAYLASRPFGAGRHCTLGRETCLERVVWAEEGWLRLAQGGHHPHDDAGLLENLDFADDFRAPKLDLGWQALRRVVDETWLSLRERPGWLRLRGGDSLHSLFDQSMLARRLEGFELTVRVRLDFSPRHFTQMAGLVFYYHTGMHFYLRVTWGESAGRVLGVVLTDGGRYDEIESSEVGIDRWDEIHLRADVHFGELQFSASPDGREWQNVGPLLEAWKLSDDYAGGFTGTMIGLCAQDLAGTQCHADFGGFSMLAT